MKVAVIGSGVAGVSAARALIARGLAVTILDVGETLDAERRAVVDRLKRRLFVDSSEANINMIRGDTVMEPGGLPEKLHFGSDYIYATDRSFALTSASKAPYPTFAKGGFSNIWGAAILPTDACDMADWPVSRQEMDPYFCKAAELLPLTGGGGTLSRSFPSYKGVLGTIDPGPQARLLLSDLERAEPALLQEGTLYGRARLVVHTEPADVDVLACNGCGECSIGCVRGAIYSTVAPLEGMIRRKEIDYRDGVFVERILDSDSKVTIEGIDLKSNGRFQFAFDAAFIAAGPINTTRLLLRSREIYDRSVRLKESQKFILPILRRRSAPTTFEQPSITLAGIFLESKISALSDHWLHAQIVSMNRTISDGSPLPLVDKAMGRKLWSPLLRRVMVAWCGMHSDHSSHLELTLKQGSGLQPDRLTIESRVSDQARATARLTAKELFRRGRLFDTFFCYWMMRFSYPGRATHCGSSFPMMREPSGEFASDRFGRPFNWFRTFVVDSSVLPSIPGTTTAFPVMANAYRIGHEAPI
jgi:choline dehydrogenase-like flavoprotein